MDDHCGTVMPVVSLPHESVIVLVSKPPPMAWRTGGLNHPCGGEDLPVVGDALFGFDVVHGTMHSGRRVLSVTAGERLNCAVPTGVRTNE